MKFTTLKLLTILLLVVSWSCQPNTDRDQAVSTPKPDVLIPLLSKNVKATLADQTTGWSYQIWHKEKIIQTRSGGFRIAAVDSKNDTALAFNPYHRMHVASISKSITAIALAKMLDIRNLNWDQTIKEFLPEDWRIHASLENTTFGQLLEMKSGLNAANDAISSSYTSLKKLVEKGVDPDDIGQYNYQNASYGLLRVLIGTMHGPAINRGQSDTTGVDNGSAGFYLNFVNDKVLRPANIPFAVCKEMSDAPTLMYPFPYHDEPGLITGFSGLEGSDGDLSQYAGGLGWYLSVDELGKLLSTFFNSNKILSKPSKKALFKRSFPFNKGQRKWGSFFSGMGMWIWSKPNAKYNCGLNTVFLLFPDDVLLVASVNSKGKGIKNLKVKSISAYSNSIKGE